MKSKKNRKSKKIKGGVIYNNGGDDDAYLRIKNELLQENADIKFLSRSEQGKLFILKVSPDAGFLGLNDTKTEFSKPITSIIVKFLFRGITGARSLDTEVNYTQKIYEATAVNGHPFTPSVLGFGSLTKKESDTFDNYHDKDNKNKLEMDFLAIEYVEGYKQLIFFFDDAYKKLTNNNISDQLAEKERAAEITEEIKKVCAKVCAYLLIMYWKTKLVHNDLHAGNILINENQDIKIIDFDNMLNFSGTSDTDFDINDFIKSPDKYYVNDDRPLNQWDNSGQDIIFDIILYNFLANSCKAGIEECFKTKAQPILESITKNRKVFVTEIIEFVKEYINLPEQPKIKTALDNHKYKLGQICNATISSSGNEYNGPITKIDRVKDIYRITDNDGSAEFTSPEITCNIGGNKKYAKRMKLKKKTARLRK